MASSGSCLGYGTGEGQGLSPSLGETLSASLMGWEAPCCFSGLPWYWDNAVAGLWHSTSLPARLLYWSEVGSQPRLMEATMDGSRRHVLVSQGLGWPTALALDLPTWRIFWLDEKLGSIGSARLDGTGVKVCGGALVTGPWWGLGWVLMASLPGSALGLGPEPLCGSCVRGAALLVGEENVVRAAGGQGQRQEQDCTAQATRAAPRSPGNPPNLGEP